MAFGKYDAFELRMKIAKFLCQQLSDERDRVISANWLHKFENTKNDVLLRDEYLDLLILSLEQHKLVDPFKCLPCAGDTLEKFDKEYTQKDIMDNIRREEFKENGQPPFVTDVSGDFCEYVAYQEIPNFGAHFSYIQSPFELAHWNNLENVIVPPKCVEVYTVHNIELDNPDVTHYKNSGDQQQNEIEQNTVQDEDGDQKLLKELASGSISVDEKTKRLSKMPEHLMQRLSQKTAPKEVTEADLNRAPGAARTPPIFRKNASKPFVKKYKLTEFGLNKKEERFRPAIDVFKNLEWSPTDREGRVQVQDIMIKRTPTLRTELGKLHLYDENTPLSPEALDILRELNQTLQKFEQDKPIVLSNSSEERKKEIQQKLDRLKTSTPRGLDFTQEDDDVELIEPVDIPYDRFVWQDLPEDGSDEIFEDDILDEDQMEIDDVFNEDAVTFADTLARVPDLINLENPEMDPQLQNISDDQSTVFDERNFNKKKTFQDFRRNLLDLVGAYEEIPYDFESPALMEYFSAQGDLLAPTQEVSVNPSVASVLDVSDENENLQRPLIRLPGEIESEPETIELTESESEIIDVDTAVNMLARLPKHHQKYLEELDDAIDLTEFSDMTDLELEMNDSQFIMEQRPKTPSPPKRYERTPTPQQQRVQSSAKCSATEHHQRSPTPKRKKKTVRTKLHDETLREVYMIPASKKTPSKTVAQDREELRKFGEQYRAKRKAKQAEIDAINRVKEAKEREKAEQEELAEDFSRMNQMFREALSSKKQPERLAVQSDGAMTSASIQDISPPEDLDSEDSEERVQKKQMKSNLMKYFNEVETVMQKEDDQKRKEKEFKKERSLKNIRGWFDQVGDTVDYVNDVEKQGSPTKFRIKKSQKQSEQFRKIQQKYREKRGLEPIIDYVAPEKIASLQSPFEPDLLDPMQFKNFDEFGQHIIDEPITEHEQLPSPLLHSPNTKKRKELDAYDDSLVNFIQFDLDYEKLPEASDREGYLNTSDKFERRIESSISASDWSEDETVEDLLLDPMKTPPKFKEKIRSPTIFDEPFEENGHEALIAPPDILPLDDEEMDFGDLFDDEWLAAPEAIPEPEMPTYLPRIAPKQRKATQLRPKDIQKEKRYKSIASGQYRKEMLNENGLEPELIDSESMETIIVDEVSPRRHVHQSPIENVQLVDITEDESDIQIVEEYPNQQLTDLINEYDTNFLDEDLEDFESPELEDLEADSFDSNFFNDNELYASDQDSLSLYEYVEFERPPLPQKHEEKEKPTEKKQKQLKKEKHLTQKEIKLKEAKERAVKQLEMKQQALKEKIKQREARAKELREKQMKQKGIPQKVMKQKGKYQKEKEQKEKESREQKQKEIEQKELERKAMMRDRFQLRIPTENLDSIMRADLLIDPNLLDISESYDDPEIIAQEKQELREMFETIKNRETRDVIRESLQNTKNYQAFKRYYKNLKGTPGLEEENEEETEMYNEALKNLFEPDLMDPIDFVNVPAREPSYLLDEDVDALNYLPEALIRGPQKPNHPYDIFDRSLENLLQYVQDSNDPKARVEGPTYEYEDLDFLNQIIAEDFELSEEEEFPDMLLDPLKSPPKMNLKHSVRTILDESLEEEHTRPALIKSPAGFVRRPDPELLDESEMNFNDFNIDEGDIESVLESSLIKSAQKINEENEDILMDLKRNLEKLKTQSQTEENLNRIQSLEEAINKFERERYVRKEINERRRLFTEDPSKGSKKKPSPSLPVRPPLDLSPQSRVKEIIKVVPEYTYKSYRDEPYGPMHFTPRPKSPEQEPVLEKEEFDFPDSPDESFEFTPAVELGPLARALYIPSNEEDDPFYGIPSTGLTSEPIIGDIPSDEDGFEWLSQQVPMVVPNQTPQNMAKGRPHTFSPKVPTKASLRISQKKHLERASPKPQKSILSQNEPKTPQKALNTSQKSLQNAPKRAPQKAKERVQERTAIESEIEVTETIRIPVTPKRSKIGIPRKIMQRKIENPLVQSNEFPSSSHASAASAHKRRSGIPLPKSSREMLKQQASNLENEASVEKETIRIPAHLGTPQRQQLPSKSSPRQTAEYSKEAETSNYLYDDDPFLHMIDELDFNFNESDDSDDVCRTPKLKKKVRTTSIMDETMKEVFIISPPLKTPIKTVELARLQDKIYAQQRRARKAAALAAQQAQMMSNE